jgi:hypothetical protein
MAPCLQGLGTAVALAGSRPYVRRAMTDIGA